MSDDVKLFVPRRENFFSLRPWGHMFSEIVSTRELIWRLFLRDFSARYRQTMIGFLWAALNPAAAMAAFWVMNRAGILTAGQNEVPFLVYGLVGMTFWQLFAGGLSAATGSIVAGGPMVVKINFPKECLVLASLGQVLFETLVRATLVAIIMIGYGFTPAWQVVLALPALLPLLMLTLGLGFILSLLNTLYRDIASMLTVLTSFLLFLTPVLYPAPESGLLAAVNRYNPVAGLIVAAKDLTFAGRLSDPHGYAVAAAVSIAVFLFGWRLFHLAESRVAERIGAL